MKYKTLGGPKLEEEQLGRLMKLLKSRCGVCSMQRWLFDCNAEILGRCYLEYRCTSCGESTRKISVDYIKTGKLNL